MAIAETSVKLIAGWLSSKKSRNIPIVLFLGSRTGSLFKNKDFYDQIQSYHALQFDSLNELEKFYECYRALSQLNDTESHNILTTSLREELGNLSGYNYYLAMLMKTGFFDVIITTNIDSFLEEALQREKVHESRDHQILIYKKHTTNEIIHPPDGGCVLLKIFGDLKNGEHRTASNEFDLRADKNLRSYLERLLARDILVIGYDKEWDFPLEWAFPCNGGDFVYVNEAPPTPELLLTRALKDRRGKYLAQSQQEKPMDVMKELYFALEGKTSRDSDKVETQVTHQSSKTARTRIFISYCHKDVGFMQRLEIFLQGYSRQGLVDTWDDTKIPVGANWSEEIESALRTTKVAVLLLSADFFASDFISKHELPTLLKRAEAGEIKLILVILSHCDFYNSLLSSRQSVNPPSKPLKGMSDVEQDEVWEKVKLLVTDK